MPHWPSNLWLTSPPTFPGGTVTPAIVVQTPRNGAANVPTNAVVCYAVYYTGAAPSITVTLDGNPLTGPGWLQYSTALGQRTYGGFALIDGFAPNTVYTVQVTAGASVATWSFTTAAAPAYPGNDLLPEEKWLLTPMTRFLSLEPLRMLLLQRVLDDTQMVISNRDNVAARAIYQRAYETELSSVLNPFMKPNAAALATALTSKRSSLELSGLLEGYQDTINAGLAQLFESGALPREFRDNFADNFGSLLYSYRTSAAATLVLLARAVEEAAVSVGG